MEHKAAQSDHCLKGVLGAKDEAESSVATGVGCRDLSFIRVNNEVDQVICSHKGLHFILIDVRVEVPHRYRVESLG